jgi:hypothetical protein
MGIGLSDRSAEASPAEVRDSFFVAALLNLATPSRFNDITGYNRLAVIDASFTGPWHIPVIRRVSDLHAVLIRPDGHVAWVDLDGSAARLDQALTKWIGTPQPSQSQPAK